MEWSFEAEDVRRAHDARGAFSRFLSAASLGDELRFNAELVFGELFGNVVRHAPGPVHVEVMLTPAEATIVVKDAGPGFDLRIAAPERDAESGRGLAIVRALAEELCVIRRRTGCEVSATIAIDPRTRWADGSIDLAS